MNMCSKYRKIKVEIPLLFFINPFLFSLANWYKMLMYTVHPDLFPCIYRKERSREDGREGICGIWI